MAEDARIAEILYEAPGVRAWRDGKGTFVIRSARRPFYAGVFALIFCLFAPFLIAFPALIAIEVGKGWAEAILALACFGAFLVFVVCIEALSIALVLIFIFARHSELDLANGTGRFRHIPGFSGTISLADIESVDVVIIRDHPGGSCFLGLSKKGRRSLIWIHTVASRRRTLEELREEVMPLAELASTTLDRTVEVSWGRSRWLRTVKGNSYVP